MRATVAKRLRKLVKHNPNSEVPYTHEIAKDINGRNRMDIFGNDVVVTKIKDNHSKYYYKELKAEYSFYKKYKKRRQLKKAA